MKYTIITKARVRNILFMLVAAISAAGVLSFSPARAERSTSIQTNSPDAQKFNGRIAFTSTRNSQAFDIYSINPDGSSPLQLTDDQGHTHNPNGPTYDFDQAWSPDGSRIAFVGNRDGDSFEIFTMDADGSNVQRLTNNNIHEGNPAWSPDGSKIAFTRGGGCAIVINKTRLTPSDDNPCIPHLYVMNSDGTNPVKLSETEGDSGAVWSPDGSKIALTVVSSSLPDAEIYVMNSDGSNRLRLTNNNAVDYVSSWAPDGSKLAFSSNRDASESNLYVFQLYTMNPDGSGQIRLTNNQTDDNVPIFSPDGTKIAFQRGQSSPVNPADNTEIFVMNVDGSNQVNITNSKADDFGPPSWQPLSSPPDNPPPAVLQFSSPTYSVNENAGAVQITLLRSGNTNEATSVQFETRNGTASNVSDYTIAFGTLDFAPGDTSKNINVLLTDDAFVETAETMSVTLHDLTGDAILGTPADAFISITDNDSPGAANPIDDSRFFVRQHYHDFLNREPDPAGFDFWVENIESCGVDAQCREVKRIETSALSFCPLNFNGLASTSISYTRARLEDHRPIWNSCVTRRRSTTT